MSRGFGFNWQELNGRSELHERVSNLQYCKALLGSCLRVWAQFSDFQGYLSSFTTRLYFSSSLFSKAERLLIGGFFVPLGFESSSSAIYCWVEMFIYLYIDLSFLLVEMYHVPRTGLFPGYTDRSSWNLQCKQILIEAIINFVLEMKSPEGEGVTERTQTTVFRWGRQASISNPGWWVGKC